MKFTILFTILITIYEAKSDSLLTGTYDPNSTVLINERRNVKEIDVLRQLVNQETLIRVSVVNDVKAAVEDVSSVKRSLASTETMVATLLQTIQLLKRDVAILKQDDTLAQKIDLLKRQIDALNRNTSLQQTVEAMKREVDFLRRDRTLQNTVESLKRDIKTQKQESRKNLENCQKRLQKFDQMFKILNENITDIHQYLARTEDQTLEKGPKDCKELYTFGNTRSGVYTIYPWGDIKRSISVYCEMGVSPGGWTVFQRRGIDKSVLFNRTWHEYKDGFGNLSTDFWLGNEVIHQLTAIDSNKLYIELKDTSLRSFHARFESFSIGPETDEYRLHVAGNFSGNITHDYVTRGGYILNGQPFVTPDRPDQAQCASSLGGGWWFNACEYVYLNGPFNTAYWVWKGSVDEYHYLEYTAMMITRG